jgi:hypothetical protein
VIKIYKNPEKGLMIKQSDLDSYLEVQSSYMFLFCGKDTPTTANDTYLKVSSVLGGLQRKYDSSYSTKIAEWKMERIKALIEYITKFKYPKEDYICVNS